jgi:hypothetical protein
MTQSHPLNDLLAAFKDAEIATEIKRIEGRYFIEAMIDGHRYAITVSYPFEKNNWITVWNSATPYASCSTSSVDTVEKAVRDVQHYHDLTVNTMRIIATLFAIDSE